MPRYAKNKMKYWRRMGNKVVISVPKTEKNDEGEDVQVTDYRRLTGRQLRAYTYSPGGQKAPAVGLIKNLINRLNPVNISIVDNEPEVVHEAV